MCESRKFFSKAIFVILRLTFLINLKCIQCCLENLLRISYLLHLKSFYSQRKILQNQFCSFMAFSSIKQLFLLTLVNYNLVITKQSLKKLNIKDMYATLRSSYLLLKRYVLLMGFLRIFNINT